MAYLSYEMITAQMPHYSQGLTRAGLARINLSIEAYCYCILGAQARTRSTIHGVSGGAIETQREFLDRIEDSIVLKNISDSIQRYQEAIADTKTRLDFAVAKGVWLMPSRMVINTESIIGYNNMLAIADETMKLKLMAGGPSKINLSTATHQTQSKNRQQKLRGLLNL